MTESFALHIPDADLELDPLDPGQIVSGAPEVSGRVVWESQDGRQIRGVWQITPGVVTDTEADELFVVVSGRATIEVEGGPTLHVGPGISPCCARATARHGRCTRRCARRTRSRSRADGGRQPAGPGSDSVSGSGS